VAHDKSPPRVSGFHNCERVASLSPMPDIPPSEEGRLQRCQACGWKNPVGRPGCANPNCRRYYEVPDKPSARLTSVAWPALVGLVVILGVIIWAAIASLGPDECEEWEEQVAEQITILQMADPSIDFFEADELAEDIVGPPPAGCE
jgi:hypothetical protein